MIRIRSSSDAYRFVSTFGLQEEKRNRLIVVYMSADGEVLDWNEREQNAALIKLKDVYAAVNAVIVTNHPNGNSLPDKYDIQETMIMRELLEAKGIGLVDQLIVGYREFYSYADERITIINK